MSSEVYLWADVTSNGLFSYDFYHTTICVDFKKGGKYLFSYDDKGLTLAPAGDVTPKKSHFLGKTDKTLAEATTHAYHLESTTYKTYDALTTNCTHFSNDLSLWLCGVDIPFACIFQHANVSKVPVDLLLEFIGWKKPKDGTSEVFLWVDPISDNRILPSPFHTTICVDFKNGGKYLFSYNDQGLNVFPAVSKSIGQLKLSLLRQSKTYILGKTDKTLVEATQHAYHLKDTTYKTYNVLFSNCNHFCNDLSVWLCGENIPIEYRTQVLTVLTDPVKIAGCIGTRGSSSS